MRFVMSEQITEEDVVKGLAGTGTPGQDRPTYKIRLGVEDLLPAVILLLLVVGYVRQELTFKEMLGYIGLTTGGGLWGLVSGKAQAS